MSTGPNALPIWPNWANCLRRDKPSKAMQQRLGDTAIALLSEIFRGDHQNHALHCPSTSSNIRRRFLFSSSTIGCCTTCECLDEAAPRDLQG